MKVLIVDVNYDYKNPLYRQTYNNLLTCMDIDFFGPGYVDRKTLEDGVGNYIKDHGQYDAVLVGIFFLYSAFSGLRLDAYIIHRNVLPYYKVNDAYQCSKRIMDELIHMNDMCKILVYYADNVTMPIADYKACRLLLNHGFYIWGMPACKQNNTKKYKYLTNYYYNLQNEYFERFIPLSFHAISYNEIFMRSYTDRKYDWCIPGNRNVRYYPERNLAYKEIKESGANIWEYDPYQKLSVNIIERNKLKWYQFRNTPEKILSFIWGKNKFISSFPKLEYIAACREIYLESMRSTKKVYAECGTGNGLVRKYYEICACGALLVAKRTGGLEEMGFRDGENCIIVDKCEDLKKVNKYYIDNEKNAALAKAGQKLILDKHMFVHRAMALKETIEAMKKGSYRGSTWENGVFVRK